MADFDRHSENIGNAQALEHVNLTVPNLEIASRFYISGLGLTRDPYIDFSQFDVSWVNIGDQQFHLPKSDPQILRGHIGLVIPDRKGLENRLNSIKPLMRKTKFEWKSRRDYIEIICPWGNTFRAFTPNKNHFGTMELGIPYVQLNVPKGTAAGISRFYEKIIGCNAYLTKNKATVQIGINQQLIFKEMGRPEQAYDGHHIAIYIADFSGPHQYLKDHNLITEESDQFQYRFQHLIDPDDDTKQPLFELEHEVRSLTHPVFRRSLVNRNAELNFFTYKKGTELFTPSIN